MCRGVARDMAATWFCNCLQSLRINGNSRSDNLLVTRLAGATSMRSRRARRTQRTPRNPVRPRQKRHVR